MTSNINSALSRTALITGASRGLGRAVANALAAHSWNLILDARGAPALERAVQELSAKTAVIGHPGDVGDGSHRRILLNAVEKLGGVDLLINNASVLGPSPLPALAGYPLDQLEQVYRVNTIAPLALMQLTLPHLRANRGTIINISSDAAVEAYEGWGGYGSSKAALDHLTAIIGIEEPDVRVYAVDPGDMRTDLQQEACPGEDISDRPEPASVVPSLLRLIESRPPSGRYRAAAVVEAGAGR